MRKLLSFVSALVLVVGLVSGEAQAQSFNSIRHHVSGSYVGNDPYGDDFPSGADEITSQLFQQFRGDLLLGEGGAQLECSLFSDLDTTNGVFYAYGFASAGLYVQGSATAKSNSNFQTVFRLDSPGSVSLTGVIGVSQFLGNYQAHDVPGTAQVFVRIRNLNTNQNVVNKVLKMNGYINNPAGIIQVNLEDEFSNVALPAGRYRLIVDAVANDSAVQEEVGGSIAVGFFEVEGTIVEN